MTLDRFKVFVAVARHRGITRVSQELHVTQPAVTKQLKALEREFNTNLYKRHGLGIELTEAGQTFLRGVKKILKGYDSLIKTMRTSRSPTKIETLTVGGSYSPSAELLPWLMARFTKSHPQIELNLRIDWTPEIERLILRGEVDLAVLINPQSNRHLTMEPYRAETLVAFVSPDHPLASKKRLTWDDVGKVGFVLRKRLGGKRTADQFLRITKEKGVTPKVLMRCDTPEAVKMVVARRMGVGLLFRDVLVDCLRKGEFKELKLPVESLDGKSFIVYHKTRPLSPLAQDFLRLLQTHRGGAPRPYGHGTSPHAS